MKKISSKIITAIIICCTILSSIIGGLAVFKSSSLIQSEVNDKMLSMAQAKSSELDKTIVNVESAAKDLSSVVATVTDIEKLKTSPADYETLMKPLVKNLVSSQQGEVMGLYVILNPEITENVYGAWFVDTSNSHQFIEHKLTDKSEFKADNANLAWYYEPIKQKKGIWSNPYTNVELQMEMISYTTPIFKDNTLIGVAGIDINFQKYREGINNIKIYDTGYASFLNDKHDYIVHKTLKSSDNLAKIDNGSYKSISDKIKSTPSGVTELKTSKGTNVFSYSKLSNGWILLMSVPESEVFKQLNSLVVLIIAIIIIGVILSSIFALYIGKKLSAPIIHSTELINRVAGLDLSYDDTSISDKLLNNNDETGVMSRAVLNLRKELVEIIQTLQENSKEVTQYSESLSRSTEETNASVDSVSRTLEELAKGAQEQARSSQLGTEKLEDLADEIRISVSSSNKVKEFSNEVKNANNLGTTSMEKLIEKFTINNEVTEKLSTNIDSLSNKSEYIGEIVNTIQAIAEQTNLLALNAAIEAARAGETGRGFAVVAEEIRKLSEQTSNSTKEIYSIVSQIQLEINTAKNNMDDGESAIKEANLAVSESNKAFKLIESAIQNTLDQIDILVENIEKVDRDKIEVISSIQEVSAISEESAAATEEISASMDEQSRAIGNISGTAEQLNNIADKLEQVINKFKI
ncbi:methyl-accepting chemotaxis protein [Clostridium sp. A1-XYC3]|uniref:Methyl-accepting chemotaxis protein n=1 Tax=Clostridium tanneri TaxID=3037988 RepID=A0ABU4JXD9_9CLOT|nr:methyl-accepting chemotaxis protein [Clostridium sp. A1-XYC3]MDW8802822.1 methyl-accepting chemotaxis protein [Clostridium sp. A1-XYC3]